MKLGVVGIGVIGKALVEYLKIAGHEVKMYDPEKGQYDDMYEVAAIFICVPAPTLPSRDQDIQVIKQTIVRYQTLGRPFILRSTVTPGTADVLQALYDVQVISCPEFLSQKTASEDILKQDIVCGDGDARLMADIFPDKKINVMTNVEAEITKYAHNCFGYLKVLYFNTIFSLCQALKSDYEKVREGVRVSGFVESTHTQVPGPDGNYGVGGHCLPKDMAAFVQVLHKNMIECSYLRRIEEINNHLRVHKSSRDDLN